MNCKFEISSGFTYAIHPNDDLRLLNAEIGNYDTRRIGCDALRRRDEAVDGGDEGHLTNDIVMDLDELSACYCLVISLTKRFLPLSLIHSLQYL